MALRNALLSGTNLMHALCIKLCACAQFHFSTIQSICSQLGHWCANIIDGAMKHQLSHQIAHSIRAHFYCGSGYFRYVAECALYGVRALQVGRRFLQLIHTLDKKFIDSQMVDFQMAEFSVATRICTMLQQTLQTLLKLRGGSCRLRSAAWWPSSGRVRLCHASFLLLFL